MLAAGTGMPLIMVMVAPKIRFRLKRSRKIRHHRANRPSLRASDDLDSRLGESRQCAATDSAAQKHLDLLLGQQIDKRTMTRFATRNNRFRNNPPIFHVTDKELRRMTEMLKHLALLLADRNLHSSFPFLSFSRFSKCENVQQKNNLSARAGSSFRLDAPEKAAYAAAFQPVEDFLAALVGLDHTGGLESRKMLGDS